MTKFFSEETRRKISESKKGKPRSAETKRKISLALRGKMAGPNHPMWGKHHSEESKRKNSLAHLGKYSGPENHNYHRIFPVETRLKMSASHLGKSLAEEHKKNISTALQKNEGVICHLRKMNAAKRGIHLPDKTRAKISASRIGPKNPGWKGGRIKDKNGYIRALAPGHPGADRDGYVFEHRLVAESLLGRPLGPEEVPHHINGIRDDNRKENIFVCRNKSHHSGIHARMRKAVEVLAEKTAVDKAGESGYNERVENAAGAGKTGPAGQGPVKMAGGKKLKD